MRYVLFAMMTQVLFFAQAAFAGGIHPSCKLAKKSIIGRTPSGLAQVSNLDSVEVRCRISGRPFPGNPGESRNGLRAKTNAYEISANDGKTLVPSEVKVFAGGSEAGTEWVEFEMLIPLDPKELEAETRRYYAKILEALPPEQRAQVKANDERKALENLRPMIAQSRVGHFRVQCEVLDGDRIAGSDFIEVEVLFKGRISDLDLRGVPIAEIELKPK